MGAGIADVGDVAGIGADIPRLEKKSLELDAAGLSSVSASASKESNEIPLGNLP
jgi:hypothetical protein